MSATFELRPGETVLFRGDVANVQSLTNIQEGKGVVTNQRCVFRWANTQFVAEQAELADVEVRKHGFAKKVEVRHANGQSVAVQSPNMNGLTQALMALAGKQSVESAQAQPDKAAVKNTWAWVAALGPVLGGILVLIIAAILGWDLESTTMFERLKLAIFRWVFIYGFLRLDHIMLQRQGFDTEGLGVAPPERLWAYLSSRAKAFGHGKCYVITWWVLVVLDLLTVLIAL